jgi:hypothetical protein
MFPRKPRTVHSLLTQRSNALLTKTLTPTSTENKNKSNNKIKRRYCFTDESTTSSAKKPKVLKTKETKNHVTKITSGSKRSKILRSHKPSGLVSTSPTPSFMDLDTPIASLQQKTNQENAMEMDTPRASIQKNNLHLKSDSKIEFFAYLKSLQVIFISKLAKIKSKQKLF